MLISILRHGRTEANAAGLLQGRMDPPLDPIGRDQARAVAAILGHDGAGPIDAVITSPLRRARQTAEIAAPELSPVTDDRWIEVDYGEWEGRPVAEVPDETWQRWRADVDFAPPAGESLTAVSGRVHAALDELVDRPPGAHVLVVTHVSPIKSALTWSLGVGDEVGWRTFVANASVTRIRVADGRRVLTAFNLTA